MTGWFITGTDTGVGKTRIGTGLARGLRHRNMPIRVRKPVESGCLRVKGELLPLDAHTLNHAAGSPEKLEQVCPYRFEAAVSPERAARLEKQTLQLHHLVTACQIEEDAFLLVEGAGGFYSPIAEKCLNADLAQALGLPIVIVANDRLGVINHVLLVLEAVINRGLDPQAIVINRTESDPPSAMNNFEDLRRWSNVPVLLCPFIPSGEDDRLSAVLHPLLASVSSED